MIIITKYPIAAMLSAELADQHDIRSNLTAAGFNFIRIVSLFHNLIFFWFWFWFWFFWLILVVFWKKQNEN